MSYNHYDRMSALDAAFLTLEDENAHMHIGSVALFDAEPLTKPGGGIDFDRILAYIEAVLPSRERFRQKLARVPVLQHPVWVDDERFNLRYHVRTCACRPRETSDSSNAWQVGSCPRGSIAPSPCGSCGSSKA